MVREMNNGLMVRFVTDFRPAEHDDEIWADTLEGGVVEKVAAAETFAKVARSPPVSRKTFTVPVG